MNIPSVSIIVPYLNHKDFIRACWENISLQTFTNYEVIFVDNGSTDGSRNIADELAKLHPEKIKSVDESKKGIPFSRNKGLSESKGEFVSFLDVDDQYTPQKLEILLRALKGNPSVAMAYGKTLRIYSESGKKIEQNTGKAKTGINNPPELALDWTQSFYLLPQTGATLIRTAIAREAGGFTESLLLGNDDIGFHLNIALNHPVYFIPEVVVHYFRHQKSEGATLNESISVDFRYLDAYRNYIFDLGKSYFRKTGDIRLWGLAQKGTYVNYWNLKHKNKSGKPIHNPSEESFIAYKLADFLFGILPYPLARIKWKIILRLANAINPDKYPV